MKRLKTFLIYLLCFVGFFVLSDFLITASLNASYHKIERKDNLEQITIEQAEATQKNVRVKGKIKNLPENPITLKYVEFDFYSERDIIVGSKYIDVSSLKENESMDINVNLRVDDVSYYSINFTNDRSTEDVDWLPTDLSDKQVFVISLFTLLMII